MPIVELMYPEPIVGLEGRVGPAEGVPRLGATVREGGCTFTVWAPRPDRLELCVLDAAGQVQRTWPLERDARGAACLEIAQIAPGTRYAFRLDGARLLPDPASRLQHAGVHGPSVVVDPTFRWTDRAWSGLPLSQYVLYELHVGTFSEEGSFDGVMRALPRLVDLGITAVELMPVAAFPGARNWGYDGVLPYAVHADYGGPSGLMRLVDACHAHGLAVVLDVVYNHLGPEGNYLAEYAPYFTETYRTPWGAALNFDGPDSDQVRRYFVENAVQWIEDYHVDALRLDAVHAIFDRSAYPILEEITDAVHAAGARLGRPAYVIAESDLNDPRLVRDRPLGGTGLDGVWNDDFHHALHALLTKERDGYYADFGGVEPLARVWESGFAYEGQYSAYRARFQGRVARDIPPARMVVCAQNHDQVGNRMLGERLSALVDLESLKLAASAVLLSPFTPLLFMGEEYAEPAPFLYFTSHGDPALVEAVRRGRAEEFAAFSWQGKAPDPQAEASFQQSRIHPALRDKTHHAVLYGLYRHLIKERAELPRWPRRAVAYPESQLLWVEQGTGSGRWAMLFAFSDSGPSQTLALGSGRWRKRFDSADARWGGQGSAWPASLMVGRDGTVRDVRLEDGALRWMGGRGCVVYQAE